MATPIGAIEDASEAISELAQRILGSLRSVTSRITPVNARPPSSRISPRDISMGNSLPSFRSPTSSVVPHNTRFARSQVAVQSAHAKFAVSFGHK